MCVCVFVCVCVCVCVCVLICVVLQDVDGVVSADGRRVVLGMITTEEQATDHWNTALFWSIVDLVSRKIWFLWPQTEHIQELRQRCPTAKQLAMHVQSELHTFNQAITVDRGRLGH